MSQELSTEVSDVCVMGLDKYMEEENWEAASKLISETLDKKFGASWNVMCGRGVGFDITYQQQNCQLMYYNNCAVLAFRT